MSDARTGGRRERTDAQSSEARRQTGTAPAEGVRPQPVSYPLRRRPVATVAAAPPPPSAPPGTAVNPWRYGCRLRHPATRCQPVAPPHERERCVTRTSMAGIKHDGRAADATMSPK